MSVDLEALADGWRAEAARLAPYAAPAAHAFEACARELSDALQRAQDAVLTLAEAARESGYSRDALRHKVAQGELPNAGRRGAPRVRRGDLPRKSRRKAVASSYDLAEDARHLFRAREVS